MAKAKTKTERLAFWVTRDEYIAAKAQAARGGYSVADAMRRLLQCYLAVNIPAGEQLAIARGEVIRARLVGL